MSINFGEIRLTSQQILDRISEQSIYEYYLNDNIKNGKLLKCCFHKDSTPSLGFYRSATSGELNYKCFGCGSQGNVFNFVSKLQNITFGQTLKLLQNTFKLSRNYDKDNSNNTFKEKIKIQDSFDEGNGKTIIIPTFKIFSKVDFDYWSQFYIPLELLVKYDIKPCERVYIVIKSGEYVLFAQHQNNNPIYSYKLAGDPAIFNPKVDEYKIYRPYSSKKGKWTGNSGNDSIQGIRQLPDKGELLIITSSMKDVLVLNVMGYNAIALGGEGNHISKYILDYLWACFDNIVVFYDNDKVGIDYGKRMSEDIGSGYIYIPTEYEDTKDISDYVKKYGFEEGIQLMKKLL